MVLPIEPISARRPILTREENEAILRYELQLLNQELPTLQKYRAYYDGDQKLVFGTEEFKESFGDAFKDFRDNWSAPVVDAVADKLVVEGFVFGEEDDEESSEGEDSESEVLADQIWDVFRLNDFDVQQSDLHEGALVEGHSYMIAWPDEDLGVRLDWNPADLIRVRYADDDPRTIIWAMKRWLTPSGNINITTYTTTAIYKYVEPSREFRLNVDVGIAAQRPEQSTSLTFRPRLVRGEDWPLPNPFGVVPVIEYINKRGSELTDVIPLQDGINYLMLQSFSAAGFQGFPQRGFFSGVKEPAGGWINHPGKVWQVPPDLDAEGNLHPGSSFEFKEADLNGFRSLIEMTLTHLALQNKTPVRMFFQSDRGGRGDAPSGESLLVEDQPLLDKVEDRQRRFGNSHMKTANLVAIMHPDINFSGRLPLGEPAWKDPRSKYRSALVEEGAKMVHDMGMPLKFVIHHLGFTADEVEMAERMIDEEHDQKLADEEAKMEMEAENAPEPAPATQSPPQV